MLDGYAIIADVVYSGLLDLAVAFRRVTDNVVVEIDLQIPKPLQLLSEIFKRFCSKFYFHKCISHGKFYLASF